MERSTLCAMLQASTAQSNGFGEKGSLLERFSDSALLREAMAGNPLLQPSLLRVKEMASTFRKAPAVSLPFSLYRQYDTTGERYAYEAGYFEHRGRLNAFALLALLTDDADAISDLEDAIWAVCDEYTWCLPAHLGGRSLAPEDAASVHTQTVDLFSAETAFALAEICSLLGERLTPVVRSRAEGLVRRRVLEPFLQGPAMRWETWTNNWSGVCAGSVGAAALYLMDDSSSLASLLLRVLSALEAFLSGYASDGACTEGLAYWNYGFGFFVTFAERLHARTGGRLNLLQGDKMREIALFQQRMWLGGDRAISFSDGARHGTWHPGLSHFLRHLYPDMRMPENRWMHRFGDDPCFRWCMDVRDFLWVPADSSCPNVSGKTEKPPEWESTWLPDAEWLISRAAVDGRPFVLAAKGGHNDEPHNHNDVGAFLLHAGGETFLDDAGAGAYTKDYFGEGRYGYLVNNSFSHSVPFFDGKGQSPGRTCRAKVLRRDCRPYTDELVLELADAYPGTGIESLQRAFYWEKSDRLRLCLTDRFQFSQKPAECVERFVSFLMPRLDGRDVLLRGARLDGRDVLLHGARLDGRDVLLHGANDMLRISCPDERFVPRLSCEEFTGHRGEQETLWMIDFVGRPDAGAYVFEAVFCFE